MFDRPWKSDMISICVIAHKTLPDGALSSCCLINLKKGHKGGKCSHCLNHPHFLFRVAFLFLLVFLFSFFGLCSLRGSIFVLEINLHFRGVIMFVVILIYEKCLRLGLTSFLKLSYSASLVFWRCFLF